MNNKIRQMSQIQLISSENSRKKSLLHWDILCIAKVS